MDKKSDNSKNHDWLLIIIGLIVLIFFFYSYQSIIKTESLNLTLRKEHFVRAITALAQPDLSDRETNQYILSKMLETIQMAFLATIFSALLASLFTRISMRPSSNISKGLKLILQLLLAAVRSVHPLVTVIFIVILTGIGAESGVLALTIFSTAVLTEKFSEFAQGNMSISWPLLFKEIFPSLTFKHFSSNLLIASILGFMGAGGIGFFLQQHINLLDFHRASTGILACILVIGSFDLLGRANWRRIIKGLVPQVLE